MARRTPSATLPSSSSCSLSPAVHPAPARTTCSRWDRRGPSHHEQLDPSVQRLLIAVCTSTSPSAAHIADGWSSPPPSASALRPIRPTPSPPPSPLPSAFASMLVSARTACGMDGRLSCRLLRVPRRRDQPAQHIVIHHPEQRVPEHTASRTLILPLALVFAFVPVRAPAATMPATAPHYKSPASSSARPRSQNKNCKHNQEHQNHSIVLSSSRPIIDTRLATISLLLPQSQ